MTIESTGAEISLRYFAALKDAAGVSSELMRTNLSNAEELFMFLSEKYRWRLSCAEVRVAVNGKFEPMTCKIHHGDSVVFIPPVSGG